MIKYSIIIPVYNCEKYLDRCINSLLNQSEQNYEIVLVDDGSVDGSGEICSRYASQNRNIKSYRKENGGVASARNMGIKKADGEYILFIDGDDTVEINTLEKISEGILVSDLVVFGMSFDFYRKEKYIRSDRLSCEDIGILSKESLMEKFVPLFYNNVFSSACNKVFRLDLIRDKGLYFDENMTLYEDLDFVLRYMTIADRVAFIDAPLYHYRIDLVDQHRKNRENNLKIISKNMERLLISFRTFSSNNNGIVSVGTNLYMQLLSLYMLRYKWKESEVYEYCCMPIFSELLIVDMLHSNNRKIYDRIMAGEYTVIRKDLSFSKFKLFIKRLIKGIFRRG